MKINKLNVLFIQKLMKIVSKPYLDTSKEYLALLEECTKLAEQSALMIKKYEQLEKDFDNLQEEYDTYKKTAEKILEDSNTIQNRYKELTKNISQLDSREDQKSKQDELRKLEKASASLTGEAILCSQSIDDVFLKMKKNANERSSLNDELGKNTLQLSISINNIKICKQKNESLIDAVAFLTKLYDIFSSLNKIPLINLGKCLLKDDVEINKLIQISGISEQKIKEALNTICNLIPNIAEMIDTYEKDYLNNLSLISQLVYYIQKYGNAKFYYNVLNGKTVCLFSFSIDEFGKLHISNDVETYDSILYNRMRIDKNAWLLESSHIDDDEYTEDEFLIPIATILSTDLKSSQENVKDAVITVKEEIPRSDTSNAVQKIYDIASLLLIPTKHNLCSIAPEISKNDGIDPFTVLFNDYQPDFHEEISPLDATENIELKIITFLQSLEYAKTIYFALRNAKDPETYEYYLNLWESIPNKEDLDESQKR